MPRPFFSQVSTQDALRTLSKADDLTVIVGAGASVEVGMPSWSELVRKLLSEVALAVGCPEDSSSEKRDGLSAFCSWTVAAEGLPGAGSIAQAWFEDDFEDAIRDLLYESLHADPRPGATARGVARLKKLWGEKCEVVTTNYDDLLQRALNEEGIPKGKIRTYVSAKSRTGENVYGVRHLHGVLTPDTRKGRVVLSEADYHLMQTPSRWQELYVRKRLQRSTCLFIGTSMSDPNLLRYLYRTGSEARHVALLVRQGDPRAFDAGVLQGVAEARERATAERWRSVGVEPLYADYFIQSAQFVHELARQREFAHDYESYGQRLVRWSSAMQEEVLATSPVKKYRTTQDALQRELGSWVASVRSMLVADGLLRRRERLGLHLWVRQPRTRSLVLWASSDRSHRDPATIEPVPIQRPTHWVAVEAFCSGIPIFQSTEGERSSRWNFVAGIPIALDNEEWGRLPVGVLTLASTNRLEESGLAEAFDNPALNDEIGLYLAGNGADLLTPRAD